MKFIFNKKILIIFTGVVLAGFATAVFATPPASFYNPGETLNPTCLPTDVNCDVRAPLTSDNISDTAYGVSWDTDTTHAPSKNAVYDVINALPAGHDPVTLGTANGLSLSTQVLSLGLSSASTTGALSNTDWNTFNNKQDALGFTPVTNARTITINGTTQDLSADRTYTITNITGNAGTATALQNARSVYGNSFDGTADLGQVISSTFGGTGNGFTKFTGPTTTEKTFTLPDASATLLYAGGALGTPSSGVATNLTGTASGLTAGNVTTNANLTGPITSIGNATSIASQTGTGTTFVMQNNPTLVTPVLGAATATTINGLTITSSTGTLTITNGKTLSVPLDATVSGTNTGDQTSVSGNAGTATALQTGRTISISGDLTYTSPSFDGTSNITAAGTLATVNSNVGSFGSATQVGTFTVNGKGLITAAGNTTITPAVGSITGLGTGVATALGVNVGSAGAFVINGGALGTPSSGVATNLTGTASGLTAGNVTTNANLTGPITSVGNATSVASQTGTGSTFVMNTSPTLVTPNIGTATGSVSGNAGTATALQNARTIGGVSFDGTGNITVASATGGFTVSGGNLTTSAINIVTDTTTGTKIGTATNQKLGFFNSAPVVQQSGNLITALSNLGLVTSGSIAAGDVPTLNQNTTGSAAKWTTARNLAGNSVDGSADVAFANKFIVQGTADSGLSSAQFLGALGTGILKNTTTTGVLSIAVAGDFPTLNQNTTGSAATLTTTRTIWGQNFNGSANVTGDLTLGASNLVTDTTTGTKIGTATNQKLAFFNSTPIVQPSGDVATALTNLGLITSPTITATTNANLTGPITSVGNVTSVASQTGTGSTFVMNTSPTLVTPNIGVATATSINGNIFTTGSSTYTGTAGQTYTFPTTSATIARTDAAQTFTGIQQFSNIKIGTATTADSNADSIFAASAAGKKALVLQAGAATTTQNIFDVQKSDGTSIFGISSNVPSHPLVSIPSPGGILATPLVFYDGNPNSFAAFSGGFLYLKQNGGDASGIRWSSDGTPSGSNNGTEINYVSAGVLQVGPTGTGGLNLGTLNGNTFTAGSYTLTGAAGKTLTFNNSLTLAGTDGTTMTFPSTSATIARTDAAQTFTGLQTFSTSPTSPGSGLQTERFGSGATTGSNAFSTAIGNGATATGQSNVALGAGATATSTNEIAIGTSSNAGSNSPSIALGTSATTTAANQMVIGANGSGARITDVYIGAGVTSTTASSSALTINSSGGSGADNAGANITIAGGKGTGNSAGGSIIFSTSDAGVSSSTLQSLTTKMTILSTGLVGIGTTGPLSKLDVNGGVAIGSYAGVNAAPSNGLIVSGYAGINNTSAAVSGVTRLGITGNGDSGGNGVVLINSTNANGFGAGITLDSTQSLGGGGHKYLFFASGPADGSGAGTFSVYDGTAPGYNFQSTVSRFQLGSGSAMALQFGGTTSASPEIKRNGAALNFRLADDSADANITAGNIIASGNVGIGTASPFNTLDVVSGTLPQIHASKTAADSGEYIASNGVSNATISGGGYYNGSTWTAKAANFTAIAQSQLAFGDIDFYYATGLTPGNTFTPTSSMYISNTGQVGIGSESPGNQLDVVTSGTAFPRGISVSQYNTGAQASNMFFNKARGTPASPSTVANGDYIGLFNFRSYTNAFNTPAAFGAIVDGTVSSGVNPTDLFFTTGTGNEGFNPFGNSAVRLYIKSDGSMGFGGSMGTVGSFTGSKMVLDSSGNLAIGQTSAAAQLDILAATHTVGLNLAGTALGATTSIATNSLNILNVLGATGQNTSTTLPSRNGGLGGGISLTSGTGGDETGAGDTSNRGGFGGALSLISGTGGNATNGSGTVRGGIGGNINLTSGNGGTSVGSAASAGGAGGINLNGGTGGVASGVSSSGAGGGISLFAGSGGGNTTSGGTAGPGGSVFIDAGSAGFASGGANPGTNGSLSLGTLNASGITIGNTSALTGATTLQSGVTTGTTTSSAFVLNAAALTTGTAEYLTSGTITTGKLLDVADTGNVWTGSGTTNGLVNFASSSIAGTGSASSILLNIARSGTNTNASHTAYGLYSNVTNTGTTSTNVGGYFSASGATNNYGLIVANGNVGIGTTSPTGNLAITQTATATGALNGIVYTGAVNTNQTLSTEIPAVTLTTAGRQWATGDLTTQREVLITQPTYSFVGASTITDAATVGIAGAPIAGTNATLTNSHGLLIQAGAVASGTTNSYGLTVNAQTGATVNYAAEFLGGSVGIGTSAPSYRLQVAALSGSANVASFTTSDFVSGSTGSELLLGFGAGSGNTYSSLTAYSGGETALNNLVLQAGGGNVGINSLSPAGLLEVKQTAASTGALKGLVYTGAVNTGQTASTEIPAVTFTTAGRQWATGALATQREVLITQPTYSFVGASTITNAATLGIAGAPIKSTNATITNAHGLLIQAGAVSTAANSYGLTVNAQTGATSNYAAEFLGGNVGIGTTAPGNILHVTGAPASGTATAQIANTLGGTTQNNGLLILAGNNTGVNASQMITFERTDATVIGSISQNAASTVAFNTSSDRRIKENITPTAFGLSDVMKIGVSDFTFSSDPNKQKMTGFIAQDLYAVFPGAVTTNGDNGTDPLAPGKSPWMVDYSKLTPLLVKSIQDLNLNLEGVAGTITPIAGSASESFVTAFFTNIKTKIGEWLADATNGIENIFAKQVNTNTLCVSDDSGAKTCITKSQLDALLAGAGGSSSSGGGSTITTTTSATTTPPTSTTTSSTSLGSSTTGGATSTTPTTTTTPDTSTTTTSTAPTTTTTSTPSITTTSTTSTTTPTDASTSTTTSTAPTTTTTATTPSTTTSTTTPGPTTTTTITASGGRTPQNAVAP
jgi:hypothetical protein